MKNLFENISLKNKEKLFKAGQDKFDSVYGKEKFGQVFSKKRFV